MSCALLTVLGLVTIQDRGRPGRMHEGLPPGGALVPELLTRAKRLARNRDGAAAIEVRGTITIRATQLLEVEHNYFTCIRRGKAHFFLPIAAIGKCGHE